MRISDWSSDVCSSDLPVFRHVFGPGGCALHRRQPLSPEDAWNRLLRYAGHWTLLGYGIFAVVEQASGRFIGETGIADFHRGLGDDFDQAIEATSVFCADIHGSGSTFAAAHAAHDSFAVRMVYLRTEVRKLPRSE